ncbi:hypothetical protein ACPC54_07905 [Kitasatospora sp. NPDC094028]
MLQDIDRDIACGEVVVLIGRFASMPEGRKAAAGSASPAASGSAAGY